MAVPNFSTLPYKRNNFKIKYLKKFTFLYFVCKVFPKSIFLRIMSRNIVLYTCGCLYVKYKLSLSEFSKTWSFSTNFVYFWNINFCKNPFNGSGVIGYEWTDNGQSSQTHYSLFENVRSARYRSRCHICKIFTWHRLTFVGLEAAEFENNLTIVVNCYYVEWPTQECCETGEMNAIW
jgi:hypothetical protein